MDPDSEKPGLRKTWVVRKLDSVMQMQKNSWMQEKD